MFLCLCDIQLVGSFVIEESNILAMNFCTGQTMWTNQVLYEKAFLLCVTLC